MIHTVQPNKRQKHEPDPIKVLHRSTEFIYGEDGKITKVKSNTFKKPETVEREKAFVAHVHRYTEARRAADLAKKAARS